MDMVPRPELSLRPSTAWADNRMGLVSVEPHPADRNGQVCRFACGCRLANFPSHQLLMISPGHGCDMRWGGFIGQREIDRAERQAA